MSTPKAQFQVDHGSGWETVAEVDIIGGVVKPPNEWTMVRALGKRIVYVGYTPVKTAIAPPDERTNHFAGFAKAVRQEEQNAVCGIGLNDWTPTKAEKVGRDVVARRTYDLVAHVLQSIDYQDRFGIDYAIKNIPDLTELPEEERGQ